MHTNLQEKLTFQGFKLIVNHGINRKDIIGYIKSLLGGRDSEWRMIDRSYWNQKRLRTLPQYKRVLIVNNLGSVLFSVTEGRL